MRIFARVAAVQNLSAVGHELGLTPGTISKRIQALEESLGARLFDRTTRSIRITEEGDKLLAYVERILSEIENARAAVGANIDQPKGRLRVSAPSCFGRRCVVPAICTFAERYREIEVQVDLTDGPVNLQEDGYDVVIRAGELSDSALIAKRLAADPQVVVAAPAYLAAHGVPRDPRDIAKHSCLVLDDATQWTFAVDGEPAVMRVTPRLRSDNGEFLRHAALQGLGLLYVSQLGVADDIESGQLVPVLEAFAAQTSPSIWALYPSTRHVLPKLRVFLDFLGEWFREPRQREVNGVTRSPAVALAGPAPRAAGASASAADTHVVEDEQACGAAVPRMRVAR